MINLANSDAANAEEICSRGELSRSRKPEAVPRPTEDWVGTGMLHRTQVAAPDQVQLRAAQRIEVSLRYMLQHLNQPIRVSELSAMAGLSESSFFALFKSATGLTPLVFFIRARMQRAGELLAETTLQIKEVAALLGYDDQFYFSRLFKSVHGVAPREYRARQGRSGDRNFTLKPASEKAPAANLPPHLSRLFQAAGLQMSGRALIGGFQPVAPRANTFQENCRASSPPSGQTCSVSVHP